MSTHKHFDKICCVVLAAVILITVLFMNGENLGIQAVSRTLGYEVKLFDTSSVHSINIIMDDWDSFIETCTNEEYTNCTVIIDGEAYKNVAIRAKGNTSLSQVKNYGNDRYSFKIEFDKYDSSNTYYGLDKLCLNNIIQDNTYMKDYLTYQLMGEFGASSPLCSYANIQVNGEDWGLYLAVEAVEESFLQRNYGSDYGELYKPDSMSMGGGRGNGKEFNMEDFEELRESFENGEITVPEELEDMTPPDKPEDFSFEDMPSDMTPPDFSQGMPFENGGQPTESSEETADESGEATDKSQFGGRGGNRGSGDMKDKGGFGGGGGMGSDDVSLIYSDDSYSSYSNIFDNAKTDVTNADKDRLIAALKNINENTDIENSVITEEVIRYFVVHNFVLNFDSYTGSMIHNYYLYEKDGALSMIPWDYNLAFGGFQSMSDATTLVNYPIDDPVSGGTTESRPMLAWIFSNEEYTKLYHEYFSEFITECFDSGYFENMIDSVKEMISPYVESDPTKFCTYEEFVSGIDTLKEFCLLRAQSVAGQLDGSIPSTSESQQDTSAFVDAGDISVSAMGSMGNMGGGGGMHGMNNTESLLKLDGVKELYEELSRLGLVSDMPETVDEIIEWVRELISSGKLDSKWSETVDAAEKQLAQTDKHSPESTTDKAEIPESTTQTQQEIPETQPDTMPDMQGGTSPEMPQGGMPDMQGGTPPEMPQGGMPDMQGGTPPEMPQGGIPDMQGGASNQRTQGGLGFSQQPSDTI